MKKLLFVSIGLILINSCSNRDSELKATSIIPLENSVLKTLGVNNTITITLNYSPIAPICDYTLSPVHNNDLQISLSEPAPYDIELSLGLRKKVNSSYLQIEIPWNVVIIPKGQTWITLPVSCDFQGDNFIQCGQYTEIKTGNFRLEVLSAKYFDAYVSPPTFNYSFYNNQNYFDFVYERSCVGGGWNPDKPDNPN